MNAIYEATCQGCHACGFGATKPCPSQSEEYRQSIEDYEDRVRATQICGYEVCDMEPCSFPEEHLR